MNKNKLKLRIKGTERNEKARILNENFSQVFTSGSSCPIPIYALSTKSVKILSMDLDTFSIDDVLRYIDILKPKKSQGLDNPSKMIIKSYHRSLATRYLLFEFNSLYYFIHEAEIGEYELYFLLKEIFLNTIYQFQFDGLMRIHNILLWNASNIFKQMFLDYLKT
ncbi:hypothetical protein BpHYR1_031217 [Brachionus plicatilis]|uniref:Uncharacterized protein n=1 Tax=Brachionus plicatilis TaxID=10195 RepID=A0A3M7Q8K0_BRAPC|nr:hypothetical protein BpHYR1_031217 [Brachionus plicatilis]